MNPNAVGAPAPVEPVVADGVEAFVEFVAFVTGGAAAVAAPCGFAGPRHDIGGGCMRSMLSTALPSRVPTVLKGFVQYSGCD